MVYLGVSVYWPQSVLCVCVCVCVCVWYQIKAPVKNRNVSDLSKLDGLLHKTHIKVLLVLKFKGSTCVDPCYHWIAHQLWNVAWSSVQPKKQDYRKSSRSGGWKWKGIRGGGGVDKLEKGRVGNIGRVFIK